MKKWKIYPTCLKAPPLWHSPLSGNARLADTSLARLSLTSPASSPDGQAGQAQGRGVFVEIFISQGGVKDNCIKKMKILNLVL